MEISQDAGKSCAYAYILGVYLGDGCVTYPYGKPMFRLNTIDEDFALAVKKALKVLSPERVGICCYAVKKSTKPNYALWSSNWALCGWLSHDTRQKQEIPFHLVKSREEKKAFIVGLMDSKGFVAEKTQHKTGRAYYMGFKSCDEWIPQFIQILKSVGVKIGKVSECPPSKEGYLTPTRFHIKMQSWVDAGLRFNIRRKQARVDRWAATVPYSERSLYPRKLTPETLCPAPDKG